MATRSRLSSPTPRLLDQVRHRIRVEHHALRTEQVYVGRVKRFICFRGPLHPRALGAAEVEAFLSDLAVNRQVSTSTQNQAKAAIRFLIPHIDDLEARR